MSNYKFTLNLPSTNFPMKANLAIKEPLILQRWKEDDIYYLIRKAKEGGKKFLLHDGPPYANGNIHIGHAVNKILKDIIIKSKNMDDFDAPFIPGWDCHGLPIEHKVEQIIGNVSKKINLSLFRKQCRAYANEQILIQKQDFIRLGVIGDWQSPYLTMDFQIEANIIRALGKIIEHGFLYQGAKPVHWCLDCCSSLAEAEVEYYEKTSLSLDVLFYSKDTKTISQKFNIYTDLKYPIMIVIWTSTPWTLPANRAIAIHPEFEYQLIKIKQNQYLIIAKELVSQVMKRIKINHWEILGSTRGVNLENLLFFHPFLNRTVPVVLGKNVTLDIGTGAVHIAPNYGIDDYILGKRYKLNLDDLINANGFYKSNIHPMLDNVNIFKVDDIIINLLTKNNTLLHSENILHSYPHCWRHKNPIIYRATPQWFINLDHKQLRTKLLNEIQKVQWIPEWGKSRITSMIMNRPDWCISRQRAWGVPMTIFVHKTTKKLHPKTLSFINKIAISVERHGIQAWWDLNIDDFLGQEANEYNKVNDTLDVWFDSGTTHFSVFKARSELDFEFADMYLEGSDQHRGWFMSSLITSTAIKGRAPYKKVLTHGFTVDSRGLKMSKSIGNTIKLTDMIDKFGADIIRLWVASTDYSREIAVSDEILQRSSDIYRRIRNTARFLLANLNNFNPEQNIIKPDNMILLDKWAIHSTKLAQDDIMSCYDKYNFHQVIHRIMQFCSIEMGSFYFEIIKDRQYTFKSTSVARYSCQTALWHIIQSLVRWISPILSFTADEIWHYLPKFNAKQCIFTESWYNGLFELDVKDKINFSHWNELIKLRNEVNKVIEEAREKKIIGTSLEASIYIYAKPELVNKLTVLNNELKFFFLTSEVIIQDYNLAINNSYESSVISGLKIYLNKANGHKCQRCWNYTTDIGKTEQHPTICYRCYTNIAGNGEKRNFV